MIEKLGPYDVLLGRGAPISEYDGNVRLRELVVQRQPDYVQAVKRQEKHRIAMGVVKTVQCLRETALRARTGEFDYETSTSQIRDLLNAHG